MGDVMSTYSLRLFAAAAVAFLVSGPALSAPLGVYDWTGFYVGVGGSFSGLDVSVGPGSLSAPGTPGTEFSGNGAMFDIFGGVNAAQDNFLYGLEAELSLGKISGTNEAPTVPSLSVNAIGSLSGRVGLVYDHFTIFGKLGLAVAAGSATEDHGYGDKGSSEFHFGGLVGVGAEYQMTESVSIRGELSYAAFADATYDFPEDAEHSHEVGLTVPRASVSVLWAFD